MNQRISTTLIWTVLGFITSFNNMTVKAEDLTVPIMPVQGRMQVIPGENSIDRVVAFRDEAGSVTVQVDYFFTGKPHPSSLTAEVVLPGVPQGSIPSTPKLAKIGKNSISLQLDNPKLTGRNVDVTHEILVVMHQGGVSSIEKKIAFEIRWPSAEESLWRQKIAVTSLDQLYSESVSLVDRATPQSLKTASDYLAHIIATNPKYAPAYLELARISMKYSMSAEGLKEAERNILSSLSIESGNPNAKILLGYVYVHQSRFKEAEKLFIEAEKTSTTNLWLWCNWGELYLLQNRKDLAVVKYKNAISGKRTYDTYDRARLDAYRNLRVLLADSDNELDQLYKKQSDEFSDYPCFKADFAKFRLMQIGDVQSASNYVSQSMSAGCNELGAKQTLGLVNYFKWSSNGNEFLASARAFFPESPELYYELSKNDRAFVILKKLITNGSKVDAIDSHGGNALSIALLNSDSESAKRLISAGASSKTLLGEILYPISFIPLLKGDQKSVELMKQAGVDYSKVQFQGLSAEEYAKRFGEKPVSRLTDAI